MSAIRPLATIAVLAALGVFLALKINEQGPVALNDEALQPWNGSLSPSSAATEAPPFDASQVSVTPRTAPTGGGLEEAPAFPAPPAAPAPLDAAPTDELPTLPPLPQLPGEGANDPPPITPAPDTAPIAAAPPAAAPSFPPVEPQLPESIPTAQYDDAPVAEPAADPLPAVSGRVPSLGTTTGDIAPAAPVTPVEPASPFDGVWPLIQAALERDELTRAHLLLSQWRTEPTLTANQRADVNVLLDDLAGSVVYSMDHRLEPPHTVKAGETLETIARQYGVSWRLLGKINGMTRPDAVKAGDIMKVVRGPFAAEVSLAANELVLLLDGRYAGRFPVRVEGRAVGEGVWRVEEKTTTATQSPRLVLKGTEGTIALDDSPVADPLHQGRITVAARDASDLNDILSVGSTVTIVR